MPLRTATLGDQVGGAHALMPIYRVIKAHVLAAERLHGDDATVPVLAKGKTELPDYGSMFAMIAPSPAPIRPRHCSTTHAIDAASIQERISPHGRGYYKPMLMADMASSIAKAARPAPCSKPHVLPTPCASSSSSPTLKARRARRTAASARGLSIRSRSRPCSGSMPLLDIERAVNGSRAAERLALRQAQSAPLLAELHGWLTEQLGKLSRNHDLAKAINYMLRRWAAFSHFLDDGRVCLTNNAATSAALHAPRPQGMAVLRIRSRRSARRRLLHPDPDRALERH